MRILMLALLLIGGSAQAAIYKCEIDGKTVHTDRPCDAQAEPIEVTAPNSMDAPTPAAKKLAKEHDRRVAQENKERARADREFVQQHDEEAARHERAREGVVQHKAVRGMTAADLRLALGEPAHISRSDTARGATEHWDYVLADGRTQTVTLSNDEVTAVLTKSKKKKK